jgi:hypothetical protein
LGKLLSAGADEIDVGALFEDKACGLNGVAEALDTSHSAGFHAAAVHEEGVKLDAAVGGEKAAAAGVEGRIVFEDGDGCLDCIERRSAAREDGVTSLKGIANTGLVSGSLGGGNGPGSAMNEKRGGVDGWSRHRTMVEHLRREMRLRPNDRSGQTKALLFP